MNPKSRMQGLAPEEFRRIATFTVSRNQLTTLRFSDTDLGFYYKICSGTLTHGGRVTQICVFTLQLCKTDDANLRF